MMLLCKPYNARVKISARLLCSGLGKLNDCLSERQIGSHKLQNVFAEGDYVVGQTQNVFIGSIHL